MLDELNVGKYQRTMVNNTNHKVSDKDTIEFKPGSGRLEIQDHLIRYDYRYANMPMQYTAIFKGYKNDGFQMKYFDIFLSFAQEVLTSTYNLCFRAKIRK